MSTSGGNPFTDFSGGGYFYLDQPDRAVIPTTTRHIWVVGETDGRSARVRRGARLRPQRARSPLGDTIISALPDWTGRIWFVTAPGSSERWTRRAARCGRWTWREDRQLVRGRRDGRRLHRHRRRAVPLRRRRAGGACRDLARAVREHRRQEARSDRGRLGHHADADGRAATWRSPTTPTRWTSSSTSARAVTGGRVVCTQSVFGQGAGDTDQSLVGTGRSLVVENNYGYSGPTATEQGATTTPGIERVDVADTGTGCRTVWHSEERAPSVVPKLSLANGLLYTYTKPPAADGTGRVVLHGARLPHRRNRLEAARRHGPRVQQQLRAGLDRPRRKRIRRCPGRPGPPMGRRLAARTGA